MREEKQSMSGGGAEKEEVTESQAGSRLWVVNTEPNTELKPTNCEIMTWALVGRLTDWATETPQVSFLLNKAYVSRYVVLLRNCICYYYSYVTAKYNLKERFLFSEYQMF